MNKKVIIISLVILVVLSVIAGIIVISSDDSQVPNNDNIVSSNGQNDTLNGMAPSKIDKDERQVSDKKKQELFNFIPKVYIEGSTPFDSLFMLDAAMNKIIATNEELDFSVQNVDDYVTRIFGKNAKINKSEVAVPNVAKSYFYYSEDAKSYAIIPVGYEGIFEYQIFKNATETDEAYYVYTYALIGGYAYDEASMTLDEFGDIDYENAKVQVIVGDKDGRDLVHVFDNYTAMYDDAIWTEKYSNLMPIFRYTLTKSEDGYYLTEVEQISY